MADTTTTKPALPAKAPKEMAPAKRAYLIAYNALSALLWSVVVGRVAGMLFLRGPNMVYPVVNEWLTWTQSLAALEIVHSVLGVVRAPLLTTTLQVASRLVLIWGVVFMYPTVSQSPFYSSMVLAWSSTEVIRYLYFALLLAGSQPYPLFWLRYNTFFVLYPIGITSELVCMGLAALKAYEGGDTLLVLVYVVTFIIYLPGIPTLYLHMVKQRRKVMATPRGTKTE